MAKTKKRPKVKLSRKEKKLKRIQKLWNGIYWKREFYKKGWKFLTVGSFNKLTRDIAKEQFDLYGILNPGSDRAKVITLGLTEADFYSNNFIKSDVPVVLRTKVTKQQVLELLDRMEKMKYGEIHIIHKHYDNVNAGINEVTADLDFEIEEVGF